MLVDMNIAFSHGKSPEERKKWFINTTDAMGIVKSRVGASSIASARSTARTDEMLDVE